MKKLVILSILLLLVAAMPVTPTLDPIEITEWPVPWEDTRPRDPYAVSETEVWFVGQRGDYVASLDAETGAFQRFELEEGAGPHNLVVDEEGFIWYTGNRAAHIGKLDPSTGKITKYPMPDERARSPHAGLRQPRRPLAYCSRRQFCRETHPVVGRGAVGGGSVSF